MQLEERFQGAATGETFNASGKTDILVRHQNANLFVAECKFWTGSKGLSEATDQLLGYLTWRDSKTAILVFVRNKDLSSVLAQIEPTVRAHRAFIALGAACGKGEHRFLLHLPSDAGIEIRVSVMVFHLPEE